MSFKGSRANALAKTKDLNADIGEGFPKDQALCRVISSANVCCGAHAGSWQLTTDTVEHCRLHGIRVGAHPGYPDRSSMGRTPLQGTPDWRDAVISLSEQVTAMSAFGDVAYLKPHGAFYNESLDEGPAFECLVELLQECGLPLMGMPGTAHVRAAREAGVRLIAEGFPDRRYTSEGRLWNRAEPGAVLSDAAMIAENALLLAPKVESLCIHGDELGALENARAVRQALEEHGYEVKPA